MQRPDAFRLIAILVLAAAVIAALATTYRRPAAPIDPAAPPPAAANDLATELRRCGALGPQDSADARCQAVWEENRRRFFGKPAQPLPPPMPVPDSAAPTTASGGEAR